MVDTANNTPPGDDGWQDLVTDVDGFWNEETCPQIKGKLVSITTMLLAGRETEVAVVVLTVPAKGVSGSKDEKQVKDLEPGDAIGVVIKHKLKDLYSMLANQCQVDIIAKEKIDVAHGRTMWRYGIRWRGQRVLTAAPRATQAAPQSTATPEQSARQALESI